MSTTTSYRDEIQAFGKRYDYDMAYQLEILEAAPEAYEVFARGQGMSGHRKHLTRNVHFAAHVAMMQAERCTGCLVLVLKMAVEAGVDRGLLELLLEQPEALPDELRDVRDHAFDVSAGRVSDEGRAHRLRRVLGDQGFAELAVCLAGCRLFTTVKRALGKIESGPVGRGDY
ncbi:MAG: hypothetical protein KTR15_00375 [Phycisphaeraceae bacterium]|nr:hypothetical protein [Phycisphaeraceae bacterium]